MIIRHRSWWRIALEELRQIDEHIAQHDQGLKTAAREDERIQSLVEIEGIGPVSASP